MGLLAVIGLLMLALINLPFYGVCIALIVTGLRGLPRNIGHAVLIALGLAPFVYYGYVYVTGYGEPARRAAEVASWPRRSVTPDTLPEALVIVGAHNPALAKALVAAGPFQKAFAERDDGDWLVYERIAGPDCPARERPYYGHWHLPDRCASISKSRPAFDQPHLRLLFDRNASHYRTPYTTGIAAGSVLELRWSHSAGGELVAFNEQPTFHALVFPPVLAFGGPRGEFGFLRSAFMLRPSQHIDPYAFVLDAVGFKR